MGHARALLAISDIKLMILAWEKVCQNDLSVRATELLVKEIEYKENEKEKIEALANTVAKLGGRLSGEHGYGITKKQFAPESLKRTIAKLKGEYDPDNILNRGKII